MVQPILYTKIPSTYESNGERCLVPLIRYKSVHGTRDTRYKEQRPSTYESNGKRCIVPLIRYKSVHGTRDTGYKEQEYQWPSPSQLKQNYVVMFMVQVCL